MQRREALKAGIALGTGLFLTSESKHARSASPANEVNVALIGVGLQGRALINSAMLMPNVRFRAVCDIWEYAQRYGAYYLKNYGHEVNTYSDYREMLQKEKNLDAVIVASPDWVHAQQTNACLEAGRHVYCETMMANTLDGARSMVRTMQKTGKLLQIGYQRRSNPRYLHVYDILLTEAKLTGRTTQVNTSWVHRLGPNRGWPRRNLIPDDVLAKRGYGTMAEFRNWRWFRKYSGGLFGNFGAHQLDVVNWFLGTPPRSVLANGGAAPDNESHWPSNVMALYDYQTPNGTVQASCQVLTATRGDGSGSYASFLGNEGSVKISQNPKSTAIYRDPDAPDWDKWVQNEYLLEPQKERTRRPKPGAAEVAETGEVSQYQLPVVLDKPACHPHLANFFDAIQDKAPLACPADVALANEVCVHKTNEAVAARRMLDFSKEDFAS